MASPYLDYFGLEREPFTIAPDPSLLYPSHCHREAVAHLRYGLECEGGFILLTGEVGTGKTTLTRMLLSTLASEVRVAYLLHSQYAADDLLASLLQELSIELPKPGPISFSKQCIDLLYENLLAAHSAGKKTLVVIEEAQNLSTELLEMLRLLSNLETDRSKLLHILLVGQPELLEHLAQPELRQLNQRVVSRFDLQPLAANDLEAYLDHRLRAVGAQRKLFSSDAAHALAKLTGGIPRKINLIAQQALIAAYATGADQITAALVRMAASEALGEDSQQKRSWRWPILLACLVLVALLAVQAYRDRTELFSFFDHNEKTSGVAELAQAPLPKAYQRPLKPGEHNPLLVAWLIEKLVEQGLIERGFIAGGHYQPVLVEAVRAWQVQQDIAATGELNELTVRSLTTHSAVR